MLIETCPNIVFLTSMTTKMNLQTLYDLFDRYQAVSHDFDPVIRHFAKDTTSLRYLKYLHRRYVIHLE